MNNVLNVLIVDDNKEMVAYLKSYLVRKGYQATGVYSVPLALDAIEKNVFDVMVIDVCLESFSGVSLLKSVKNRGDLCPIVMMSGFATHEMAEECLNLGAYDFLFKPFRLQIIDGILQNLKNRKERLTKMGVMV